jgi:hypothetical protein
MFPIGLKPCCGFYKILESGLTLFGCNMQNLWKNKETRKGKEEKEIKI